LEAKT